MNEAVEQPKSTLCRAKWPIIAAAAIAALLAAAYSLPRVSELAACSEITYLFLMLLGAGVCIWNAVQGARTRGFWSLLGVAFLLWALGQSIWLYHVLAPDGQRVNLARDTLPLILRTVVILAALSVRPDQRHSGHLRHRTAMDLLLLLMLWVFAYAYVQFPHRYTRTELHIYTWLFAVENMVLVAALAVLAFRATRPWTVLYGNLFGASLLYLVHRLVLAMAARTGGSPPSLRPVSLLSMAALCWYVWATFLGRRLRSSLESELRPEPTASNPLLLFSRVMVLAVPLAGLWELYRPSEPPETRVFRLLVVLSTTVLLVIIALINEYIQREALSLGLSRAVAYNTQLGRERIDLGGRLITSQEEERTRIGRELHDDLNQRLGFLAFGLSQCAGSAQEPEMRNRIQHLWEAANGISKDVHRISHELHPSALEHLGLAAAARALVAQFSRQREMKIEMSGDVPEQLSPEVALCLFRVLQECLTNAAKHAQADRVQVSFATSASGLRLSVKDDGVGFDPDDHGTYSGIGLVSMNERLRLVGGTLELQSAPFRGTTILAIVPDYRPAIAPARPDRATPEDRIARSRSQP
jgi:signal transduction histidine kinase